MGDITARTATSVVEIFLALNTQVLVMDREAEIVVGKDSEVEAGDAGGVTQEQ